VRISGTLQGDAYVAKSGAPQGGNTGRENLRSDCRNNLLCSMSVVKAVEAGVEHSPVPAVLADRAGPNSQIKTS